MTVKLTSQDRCAIDLALEQRAAGGSHFEHCFDKSGRSLERRLDAVETLFEMLDLCPAEEPPESLVARTMEFIGENAHAGAVAHGTSQQRRPYAVAHAPGQRSLH